MKRLCLASLVLLAAGAGAWMSFRTSAPDASVGSPAKTGQRATTAWRPGEFPAVEEFVRRAEAQPALALEWLAEHPAMLEKLSAAQLGGCLKSLVSAVAADRDDAIDSEFEAASRVRKQQVEQLARIGISLTGGNPGAATELLHEMASHIGSQEEVCTCFQTNSGGPENAVCLFAQGLMVAAPAATLDGFVREEELGGLAYYFVHDLAELWIQRDAGDFAEWLDSQAEGQIRDALAADLGNHLASASSPDFETAVEWMSNVKFSPWIDRWMPDILERWQDEDPEGLEAYLASPALPKALREHLERRAD